MNSRAVTNFTIKDSGGFLSDGSGLENLISFFICFTRAMITYNEENMRTKINDKIQIISYQSGFIWRKNISFFYERAFLLSYKKERIPRQRQRCQEIFL